MKQKTVFSLAVLSANGRTTATGATIVMVCTLLAFTQSGCNSFGNAKLVRELQHENERLLAEFRAERDRREKAEREKALVETRLAESEKLLARNYSGSIPNRLSSLPQYDQAAPNSFGGSSSPVDLDTQSGGNGSVLLWQRRD